MRELGELLLPHLAAIDGNRTYAKKRASPFLIVGVKGSEAYVQALASHKGEWLWLEAASARSVPELRDILTKPARKALKALGFAPPDKRQCNYWLRLRGGTPAAHREAADVLAEVLIFIFGVREAGEIDLEVHLLDEEVEIDERFYRPTAVALEGEVGVYRFDPRARCCRPAAETLAALARRPVQGANLRMSVEVPDAGWLHIQLEAGDATVAFRASNAFDPFCPELDESDPGDWTAWLKAVAEGGLPRLAIDLEGEAVEFHVLEPEDDTIRFLVARGRSDAWRPELDIRIARRTLVEALYRPLVDFWESQAFAAAWRQWCFIDSEPDHPAPWRIRSNLLDAWLR